MPIEQQILEHPLPPDELGEPLLVELSTADATATSTQPPTTPPQQPQPTQP